MEHNYTTPETESWPKSPPETIPHQDSFYSLNLLLVAFRLFAYEDTRTPGKYYLVKYHYVYDDDGDQDWLVTIVYKGDSYSTLTWEAYNQIKFQQQALGYNQCLIDQGMDGQR